MLTLAISPCPNDTFAFHALVRDRGYRLLLEDIEALNERASRGDADIVKVSVAAYGLLRERYALLRSGGAAGFGVGPLVVAARERPVGGRIAIPGERTTAALLLRQLGRFDTVPMRFDRIEAAVAAGQVDCGVLIHEGRFTWGPSPSGASWGRSGPGASTRRSGAAWLTPWPGRRRAPNSFASTPRSCRPT
jgi:1,4-dihydroxy-6-naphthoate synthase